MLNLYSIFHINIMFSSIAKRDWPVVVKNCLWPLLSIAERSGAKLGIEASGFSLEIINIIDPSWILKLKELVSAGLCEFVGSGYTQIIGPLVPSEVNAHNLKKGNEIYRSLLGFTPSLAYVNEQAYSKSLIDHYRESGYTAIFTEWNNPARFHPEWKSEWRYHSQIAKGHEGSLIPVVWNNCVAFQKFQRYANGVIDLDEYKTFLFAHCDTTKERFFPIYGNDAEIFDFRPGRFTTEHTLEKIGEWNRIEKLFDALARERHMRFVFPSEVASVPRTADSLNELSLESPKDPLPVKKQEKYNIVRWGVSGKKTLDFNTRCYSVYKRLKLLGAGHDDLWTELCFLWSSDFRTHINYGRFLKGDKQLAELEKTTKKLMCDKKLFEEKQRLSVISQNAQIDFGNQYLKIETDGLKVIFDVHKGCSLESLFFKKISKNSLLGTILHDYYDDVSLGVDWFSGHSVIAIPGKFQKTDLVRIIPNLKEDNEKVIVTCRVPFLGATGAGDGFVDKSISVFKLENKIELSYKFNCNFLNPISWRTGFVTINPKAFDAQTLFYACHNGGNRLENFSFRGIDLVDSRPVSTMVSAPRVLGNTSGYLEIGDNTKKIIITTDMAQCAALPLLHFQRVSDSFFLRACYSLCETDDTTTNIFFPEYRAENFTMTISAKKNNI